MSPKEHPQIPDKGSEWKQSQKNYWIALQSKLEGLEINGKKINFNKPGSYGVNGKLMKSGFEAALNSACAADEMDLRVRGDQKERVVVD